MSNYETDSLDVASPEATSINRGDLGVFGLEGDVTIRRGDLENADAASRTPLPGDVILISNPSANFQYKWWLKGDSEFLQEERENNIEQGFNDVIAHPEQGPFKVRRWSVDDGYRVVAAGRILMARNQDEYEKSLLDAKARRQLEAQLEQARMQIQASAEKLESTGVVAEVKRGKR